jgi:hypothetical protein
MKEKQQQPDVDKKRKQHKNDKERADAHSASKLFIPLFYR